MIKCLFSSAFFSDRNFGSYKSVGKKFHLIHFPFFRLLPKDVTISTVNKNQTEHTTEIVIKYIIQHIIDPNPRNSKDTTEITLSCQTQTNNTSTFAVLWWELRLGKLEGGTENEDIIYNCLNYKLEISDVNLRKEATENSYLKSKVFNLSRSVFGLGSDNDFPFS